MWIVRRIVTTLLLIGGSALTYLIFTENQLAGSLTGLLVLIFVLNCPISRPKTFKQGVGDTPKTPTAIAMRQTRAMIRREEGEISGTTSAPT